MAGALIEYAQNAGIQQKKMQQATLLDEAALLCKQVASQARQYNLQEAVYQSHYFLGRIFASQSNFMQAGRYYQAAIAQIERILDDLVYDLSPSFLRTIWSVYEDMIALCMQQAQFERAFSYLEQARSIALRQYLNKSATPQSTNEEKLDSTSPSILKTNITVVWRMQQELKNWQEKYRDCSTLLANIDFSVSTAIDQEIIQAELKQCETKISELFERLHLYQSSMALKPRTNKRTKYKAKHIDLAHLRQQLAPDQLLLAYFLYQGKLVIFAVTTEGVTPYEIRDGMEQIERLLPLLHAHLQPGGWPDIHHPPQQAIRRLLNKLYNLLIAPVANILPRQFGTLTIVPYGPLHNLPFHALHDGSRYLIENFQINYLPASNILMHLNNYQSEQAIDNSTHKPLPSEQPLIFGYSSNGHLQRTIDIVPLFI